MLDLGCGTGGLLARLRERGHARSWAWNRTSGPSWTCIRRGLDVVQADLNRGLAAFADGQFDYVVLSQTLQAVLDVSSVVERHAARGPPGDRQLPQPGLPQAPRATGRRGPGAADTRAWAASGTTRPNVRFLTIADFEEFCRDKGIRIHHRIAPGHRGRECQVYEDPNHNADVAIWSSAARGRSGSDTPI